MEALFYDCENRWIVCSSNYYWSLCWQVAVGYCNSCRSLLSLVHGNNEAVEVRCHGATMQIPNMETMFDEVSMLGRDSAFTL